ncbi:MAG: glycoside hydrolase family 99-like domain-containing protein [Gaiellaceae bacterium]
MTVSAECHRDPGQVFSSPTYSNWRMSTPRAIAFYLPQFHPIPENDGWWGRGFTEWTNVAKARPLFAGHEQPHLPTDLGFYDLRLPEVRAAQADMAREAGIFGFCYYHYWFGGRRLLERPFDEVLASGEPQFPFCLCWANEPWTRAWDGASGETLMEQVYSPEDDCAHIQWLLRAFRDPRYIRVEGKPLFLVYRASELPDPLRTTATWRREAETAGIGEIFLARVESFRSERGDPAAIGFDAAVEFQPNALSLPRPERSQLPWSIARRLGLSDRVYADWLIVEYDDVADLALKQPTPDYRRFPCVTPRWDNSPRRRSGGWIVRGSTPERYREWLEEAAARRPKDGDQLVFINAWNEWGEGNHLEPCASWGRAYLEATRLAFGAADAASPAAEGVLLGR